MNITIIIDVFRAFTTAAYVLRHSPASYCLAVQQNVISRLALESVNPFIIGKPEKGSCEHHIYHIPNSPTRVCDVDLFDRNVIHRTEAGAKGVLLARDADLVLVAGFVNSRATVEYIKNLSKLPSFQDTSCDNPTITIRPMGHEGVTQSLEDSLCAKYIQGLIDNHFAEQNFDIASHLDELKNGSGSYFFAEDQWQYPSNDFNLCLDIDHFDFAIQAKVNEDFALLNRCEKMVV